LREFGNECTKDQHREQAELSDLNHHHQQQSQQLQHQRFIRNCGNTSDDNNNNNIIRTKAMGQSIVSKLGS